MGEDMKKEKYYVYCQGVLGVKTNIENFRWVYGSVAPETSHSEYEKCAIKLSIDIKPEKELKTVDCYDEKFQSYFWQEHGKRLSCRRTLFGKIKMGYDIVINDDGAAVEMGKNYYRLVKKRVMNLHDAYYLLSDIANVLLLKKGFLTLYSSAVKHSASGKGIVCFAPPNTGKTLTATKMCDYFGYELIGEDIVITKDRVLYSCPYTSSYRKDKRGIDSAGAFGRLKKQVASRTCERAEVTDMIVLSKGDERCLNESEVLRRISILNGYLFNYYSSPIVKILAYFDSGYDSDWNKKSEEILKEMVACCECRIVHSKDPIAYQEHIRGIVEGEVK